MYTSRARMPTFLPLPRRGAAVAPPFDDADGDDAESLLLFPPKEGWRCSAVEARAPATAPAMAWLVIGEPVR